MKLMETIPGAKGFVPTVMPAGHLEVANFEKLPYPPRLSEAPGFWQTDDGKAQIEEARDRFCALAKKEGVKYRVRLFKKMIAHTHCIDPLTFSAALDQMRLSLIQFLGRSPWRFVYLKGTSESFVMDSLLVRGLPRVPAKRYRSDKARSKKGMKYVVVDDASYSSKYMREILYNLERAGIARESIFLGLVGLTKYVCSFELGARYVYAGMRMSTIWDTFRSIGLEGLNVLMQGEPRSSSLSFPWYKIPDKLCPMLLKSGVVREGRHHPGNPYTIPNYNELHAITTP